MLDAIPLRLSHVDRDPAVSRVGLKYAVCLTHPIASHDLTTADDFSKTSRIPLLVEREEQRVKQAITIMKNGLQVSLAGFA